MTFYLQSVQYNYFFIYTTSFLWETVPLLQRVIALLCSDKKPLFTIRSDKKHVWDRCGVSYVKVQYAILLMSTLRLKQGNFPLPIQVYSFSLQKHVWNDKQVCNEKTIRILKKNGKVLQIYHLHQAISHHNYYHWCYYLN